MTDRFDDSLEIPPRDRVVCIDDDESVVERIGFVAALTRRESGCGTGRLGSSIVLRVSDLHVLELVGRCTALFVQDGGGIDLKAFDQETKLLVLGLEFQSFVLEALDVIRCALENASLEEISNDP